MGTYQALEEKARQMRMQIVELCHRSGANKAHLGGCLSMVEILTVLYHRIMKLDKNDWSNRSRLILSKGHGALALYAALHQAGIISDSEIAAEIRGDDTFLYRHTKRYPEKGIEYSTGSLGMGLSYANGLAAVFRREGRRGDIYVIIGDGECNEGSVWESAAYASHAGFDNIIVIIDKNGLQLDGTTEEVLNMESMAEKWTAFGFETCEVDGHSFPELERAFLAPSAGKPKAIIANTIKGKGVSFAENQVSWHDNYLSDELFEIAMRELGGNLYERGK